MIDKLLSTEILNQLQEEVKTKLQEEENIELNISSRCQHTHELMYTLQ